ncbi:class D beta-lactamase [Flammeovirgaceae bacterium SG7u.111]|nr:class D beta-lactamase [Flammeovirgaceae bacterium SG7u.132]WPO34655.1 class D beta-lactamase [Flammeovirgaceae bacterium SG7u.111]
MKKNYLLCCAFAFLLACSPKKEKVLELPEVDGSAIKKVTSVELQNVIDDEGVQGAVLVFDPQLNQYYSNDFDWTEKGQLPASTFKITNSIIALETGVVEDDSAFFEWDGEERYLAIWEKDMYLRDAFQLSCVPCYQEVARKIGAERMNQYLDKLNYGHMVVDSSNIDQFWLRGESKITPWEQIDFLSRLYFSKLPIEPRTEQIMKSMMLMRDKDKYQLSGKTGWSTQNDVDNGWFVGFLEKGRNVYFVATNIEPLEGFDMDDFAKTRVDISMKALGIVI